jgi:lipoyl(octanoyl) transferase
MEEPGRRCSARWLSRVPYAEGLALQQRLCSELAAGAGPEQLLLLEHPHVITLGRNAKPGHVLASEALRQTRGVALYPTGRGGDVTYHGPGQLVGYPILDLKPDRCDVRRYLRDLEEVLIRTAGDFGVGAGRIEGLTGVWVAGGGGGRARKLAAIGVRIARWVTSHGFAFNVTTDLSYFDLIVPCGITGHEVTSLHRETGREIPVPEVAWRAATHFADVFGRRIVREGEGEAAA